MGCEKIDGCRLDQSRRTPRRAAGRGVEVGRGDRQIRQSNFKVLQDGGAFFHGSGERADGGGDRLVDAGRAHLGQSARLRRHERVS